jgi:hypothetical protein
VRISAITTKTAAADKPTITRKRVNCVTHQQVPAPRATKTQNAPAAMAEAFRNPLCESR